MATVNHDSNNMESWGGPALFYYVLIVTHYGFQKRKLLIPLCFVHPELAIHV